MLNREIDTAMYSSIVTDNLQWNPAIGRWKRRQQANNEQHAQRIDWQLLKTKNVNAVDLVAAAKLLIGKLTPKLHSEHAILLSHYDSIVDIRQGIASSISSTDDQDVITAGGRISRNLMELEVNLNLLWSKHSFLSFYKEDTRLCADAFDILLAIQVEIFDRSHQAVVRLCTRLHRQMMTDMDVWETLHSKLKRTVDVACAEFDVLLSNTSGSAVHLPLHIDSFDSIYRSKAHIIITQLHESCKTASIRVHQSDTQQLTEAMNNWRQKSLETREHYMWRYEREFRDTRCCLAVSQQEKSARQTKVVFKKIQDQLKQHLCQAKRYLDAADTLDSDLNTKYLHQPQIIQTRALGNVETSFSFNALNGPQSLQTAGHIITAEALKSAEFAQFFAVTNVEFQSTFAKSWPAYNTDVETEALLRHSARLQPAHDVTVDTIKNLQLKVLSVLQLSVATLTELTLLQQQSQLCLQNVKLCVKACSNSIERFESSYGLGLIIDQLEDVHHNANEPAILVSCEQAKFRCLKEKLSGFDQIIETLSQACETHNQDTRDYTTEIATQQTELYTKHRFLLRLLSESRNRDFIQRETAIDDLELSHAYANIDKTVWNDNVSWKMIEVPIINSSEQTAGTRSKYHIAQNMASGIVYMLQLINDSRSERFSHNIAAILSIRRETGQQQLKLANVYGYTEISAAEDHIPVLAIIKECHISTTRFDGLITVQETPASLHWLLMKHGGPATASRLSFKVRIAIIQQIALMLSEVDRLGMVLHTITPRDIILDNRTGQLRLDIWNEKGEMQINPFPNDCYNGICRAFERTKCSIFTPPESMHDKPDRHTHAGFHLHAYSATVIILLVACGGDILNLSGVDTDIANQEGLTRNDVLVLLERAQGDGIPMPAIEIINRVLLAESKPESRPTCLEIARIVTKTCCNGNNAGSVLQNYTT